MRLMILMMVSIAILLGRNPGNNAALGRESLAVTGLVVVYYVMVFACQIIRRVCEVLGSPDNLDDVPDGTPSPDQKEVH